MFKRATRLAALALAIAAAGCSGSDGSQGPQGPGGGPGPTGPIGPTGPGAMAVETCALCHGQGSSGDPAVAHGAAMPGLYSVTVSRVRFDPVATTSLAVAFSVADGGTAVANLPTGSVNMTLAILGAATGGGGVLDWIPLVKGSGRATSEKTGELRNLGGGNYEYLFANNIQADAEFAASTRTTRLGVQISPPTDAARKVIPATAWVKAANAVADFILRDGYDSSAPPTLTTTRNVVDTANCNACHERLGVSTTSSLAKGFHGGNRYDTRYCVTCHNPSRGVGRTDVQSVPDPTPIFTTAQDVADGEILGDFTVLVHKIHRGNDLTKQGYDYHDVKFNHITYPQQVNNCTKCHSGATNASNWNTVPSRKACGACHDNVNFATGTGHPSPGGARANDSACAGCHDAAYIQAKHNTHHATTHNPADPNADEFAYFIDTVTVNGSRQAVVTFRITRNGAAFDPFAVDTAQFSGQPSFLVAYALPQDGVTAPVDYNNLGRVAGQPATVNLNGTTITAANRTDLGGGVWQVTLPASSAFPVGATLRAVALQGYYTQLDIDPTPATTPVSSGRYTRSVMKAVTGDPVRRKAVNMDKCLACHETLSLHGGNRVDEPQVCVMCHNPNLSSSGRGTDPANVPTTLLALAGVTSPLEFPEASNNLKDMVHGIHGAAVRDEAFEFVRERGGQAYYYDWSEVTYPARIFNCLMCHDAGQYGADLPSGVLMSNQRTSSGVAGETRAQITAARASVPNLTDTVVGATAAACTGCHSSLFEKAHMDQNGAGFDTRGNVLDSRQ